LIVVLVAGCAPNRHTTASGFRGSIHGGQQPISGSIAQLYAVGTGGDGSAATSLLNSTVLSDSNGNFTITGDYTCPYPTDPVYLLGTGGNPGLAAGMTNPQIALMAALGPCGQLSASNFISVNELTTVAAVYSLASYMTSARAVGASTAHEVALANAFTVATELVNNATGAAPGVGIPTGESVPIAQIDTVADIVAACINSSGGTAGDGSACGSLLALTTPSAVQPPADTIAALLNLANNPALNTGPLYDSVPPASPFQPFDHTRPPDLSIHLIAGTTPVAVTVSAYSPVVYYGQTAFTATVSNPSATGTVDFVLVQGGSYLNTFGTFSVNQGAASVSAPYYPAGEIVVTAIYSGEANFAPAISAPFTATVEALPTSTALSATATAIAAGASATLTATVSTQLTTNGLPPDGTVIFRDSPTQPGSGSFYPGLTGFGDSIMVGSLASTQANAFFNLTAANFPSGTAYNFAQGGDQSEDLALKVFGYIPFNAVTADNNPVYITEDGTNEVLFCNNAYSTGGGSDSAGCLANYTAANLAAATWLTIPPIVPNGANPYITKITGQSCTPTGTWANSTTSQVASVALASSTQGSSLTCSISTTGGPIYISWEAADSSAGTMSVSIDGAPQGTLNAFGFNGQTIATRNGNSNTIFGTRYPVPAGAHTVVFTVTSPTAVANVNSVVSLATPPPSGAIANGGPYLVMMSVLHKLNYENETETTAYNNAILNLENQLHSDGLNVAFADTRDAVDPTTGIAPGASDVHPNDAGHLAMAQVLISLVQPAAPTAVIVGAGTLSSGTAQFTLTNLTSGTHYIIATYNGGGNFANSSSTALALQVH
jgi:hypothetical protein